jgi:hypothetical protein
MTAAYYTLYRAAWRNVAQAEKVGRIARKTQPEKRMSRDE